MDEVEHVIDEIVRALLAQQVLERLKVARATGLESHDFAVKKSALGRQLAGGRRQGGELPGPLLAVAREEGRLAALDARENSIAVKFDLVQPVVPGGRARDESRELGLDEPWQCGLARARKLGGIGQPGRTSRFGRAR